jgi:hypothetical protein
LFRVAELEDDLGIAGKEACVVADPSPKDERVIVEEAIARIGEQHLS